MIYSIQRQVHQGTWTYSALGRLSLADCAGLAGRLAAAGREHGIVTGRPYLTLFGPRHARVHLPAPDNSPAWGDDIATFEYVAGGPVVAAEDVPFNDVMAVVRDVRPDAEWGCELTGPVQYHPTNPTFAAGRVVWPVSRWPKDLCPSIATFLPDSGRADRAVPRLAEIAS